MNRYAETFGRKEPFIYLLRGEKYEYLDQVELTLKDYRTFLSILSDSKDSRYGEEKWIQLKQKVEERLKKMGK